jgi:hypothetical protein
MHQLADTEATRLHRSSVHREEFFDDGHYRERLAHPATFATLLERGRVEDQVVATIVLLGERVAWHQYGCPTLAFDQHLRSTAVQGPGSGIDAPMEASGTGYTDELW